MCYPALAGALSAVCSSLTTHPPLPASPTPAEPQYDCVSLQIKTGFGAPDTQRFAVKLVEPADELFRLTLCYMDKCLNT